MEQRIVPNLWFNGNAQEAVEYYLSVFPDGKLITTEYYPSSAEEGLADFQLELAGKVLTVEFEILGMRFVAINAGPEFKFSEATSSQLIVKTRMKSIITGKSFQRFPRRNSVGGAKISLVSAGRLFQRIWPSL